MTLFYRPSGNGCTDRVLILGITFLRIATTNKQGLSNGGCINDSRMVVQSVFVQSPANAALGARTDLRIQALPRLYRITPTPFIDNDFGARPYIFYYSLCINYLLCNEFFYYYYYYLRFALFFLCTGK